MALTDNLVSYWKLDESSGNATDSVGSNTLTNINSASYIGAKINNGILLNKSSFQYLKILNNLGIVWNSLYTFSFWIKLTNEITSGNYNLLDHRCLVVSSDTAMQSVQYEYNSGTRRLIFFRTRNNPFSIEQINYNITLGTSNYVHVIMTYDGVTLEGFVNGISIGTIASACTTPVIDSNTGFSLGGDLFGGAYDDGIIDEVGVWSRVLSAPEITTIYNSGYGLQYPFVFNVSVNDILSITEDITISNSQLGNISVFDILSITEYTELTFVLPIDTIIDTLSVIETLTINNPTGYTNVFDTLTITENITTSPSQLGGININDILTTSEYLDITQILINVIDTLTITENIILIETIGLSTFETLTISESITLENFRFSPQLNLSVGQISGTLWS